MNRGGIYQATADAAGSTHVQQLLEPLPHFVSYDDVPTINPHGIGVLLKGLELTSEYPEQVFATIKIDTQTEHFLSQPTPTPPFFEIHFKNRSTEWHYYNKVSKAFEPQFPPFWEPLTASPRLDKPKPTPDVIKVEKDNNNKITKLISEIHP